MNAGSDLAPADAAPADRIRFPAISRKASGILLAVLLLQFLGLGLYEAWHDSPTYDEAFALSTGVTAAVRHQLQVTSGHPPLPEVLAALPVLAARPVVPSGPNWRNGSALYADDFVNAQARAGKLREVTFLGRLLPLLEAAIAAVCMYALGSSLFAPSAGLLAAGAWLTLPFTLGLGHINGDDVPFTLVTLLVALALLRYLRTRGRVDLTLLAVACSAALLTRLIALALVPAVAAVVVAIDRRNLRRGITAGAVILTVSWAGVWACYRAVSPFPTYRHTPVVAVGGKLQTTVKVALKVPWPREYQDNIRDQARVTKLGAPAFLLGRSWNGVRWWFWPASMLVKLPLSTLVLLVAGAAAWWRLARRRVLEALLVLGVPAAAVIGFVAPEPRELGLRYMLPVIALWLVAAGAGVRILTAERTRVRSVAFVALGALAVAQLFWLWDATPHSLAWTAPPFRPGYLNASDSNLDWGQDLYALARFARDKQVTVEYFGTVDPKLVAHGSRPLQGAPTTEWLAVSATSLTAYDRARLSWLWAYCPVRTINGTILVYRFDQPPVLGKGRDRPARPCSGPISRRRSG